MSQSSFLKRKAPGSFQANKYAKVKEAQKLLSLSRLSLEQLPMEKLFDPATKLNFATISSFVEQEVNPANLLEDIDYKLTQKGTLANGFNLLKCKSSAFTSIVLNQGKIVNMLDGQSFSKLLCFQQLQQPTGEDSMIF
ncbi:hypothetical protein BDR26DRAFT_896247 [Obelidium mucronatum]|nr:hypothetical protein BDR26DRAFT_896247 [Obelidium mucronatum]